jgi:hypothetical protein
MLERLRAQARPSTPGEFWDVFMQEFKAEHLDEEIVFLYDKYFTQDEIREFVRSTRRRPARSWPQPGLSWPRTRCSARSVVRHCSPKGSSSACARQAI